MEKRKKTSVVNLMDDRTRDFELPPDRAVVAAYEQFEKDNYNARTYLEPENHPQFREYRRGYSCGDWVALKGQKEPFAA